MSHGLSRGHLHMGIVGNVGEEAREPKALTLDRSHEVTATGAHPRGRRTGLLRTEIDGRPLQAARIAVQTPRDLHDLQRRLCEL